MRRVQPSSSYPPSVLLLWPGGTSSAPSRQRNKLSLLRTTVHRIGCLFRTLPGLWSSSGAIRLNWLAIPVFIEHLPSSDSVFGGLRFTRTLNCSSPPAPSVPTVKPPTDPPPDYCDPCLCPIDPGPTSPWTLLLDFPPLKVTPWSLPS